LKRGVLDVEVQGTSGLTPYVRWGNRPILVWSALLLLLGFLLRKKRH
jgi:apolipoprotein N-acyltransferase